MVSLANLANVDFVWRMSSSAVVFRSLAYSIMRIIVNNK